MPIMTSSSWSTQNDALHASNAYSSMMVVLAQGGAVPPIAVTQSPIGTCTVQVINTGSATGATSNRPTLTPAQIAAEAERVKQQQAADNLLRISTATDVVMKRAGLVARSSLADRRSSFVTDTLKYEKMNLANLEQSRRVVGQDRANFLGLSGSRMYCWSKYGMPGDPFKVQDFSPLKARFEEILAANAKAIAGIKAGVVYLESREGTLKTEALNLRAELQRTQAAYDDAVRTLKSLAPEVLKKAELETNQQMATLAAEYRASNQNIIKAHKKAIREGRKAG